MKLIYKQEVMAINRVVSIIMILIQVAIYIHELEDEIAIREIPGKNSETEYFNAEGSVVNGIEFDWKTILTKYFELTFNTSISHGKDKTLILNTPLS